MPQNIRDVMTSNPCTIDAEKSVAYAAKMMLEEDVGLAPIVQGDKLIHDAFRCVRTRLPPLDAADDRVGAPAQGVADQALLRGRVEVDRSRRDLRPPRDLAHSQPRVPALRGLAERRGLDGGVGPGAPPGPLALVVGSDIGYMKTVAKIAWSHGV